MIPFPRLVAIALAAVVGRALAVGIDAIGRVRRGRPLHPRGVVRPGTLTTWGGRREWGTDLLDVPASRPCLVRLSRAAGLPGGWPDLHGVAVRVSRPGAQADLLFATTGSGRLTRYVLVPRRSVRAPMTALLPLRSSRGAVHLRLDPLGPDHWALRAARPGERAWEVRALLTVTGDRTGDAPVRFDPVRNLPDGLAQYPWFAAVRDPSYVRARLRHRA